MCIELHSNNLKGSVYLFRNHKLPYTLPTPRSLLKLPLWVIQFHHPFSPRSFGWIKVVLIGQHSHVLVLSNKNPSDSSWLPWGKKSKTRAVIKSQDSWTRLCGWWNSEEWDREGVVGFFSLPFYFFWRGRLTL